MATAALTKGALWMQNVDYTADWDRTLIDALYPSEGVIDGFVVAVNGGLGIQVSAGRAVIQGDEVANQGKYFVDQDAVVTMTLASIGSNRTEYVYISVNDTAVAGGRAGNNVTIDTSTTAPPSSALLLATLTLTAGTVTLTSGMIADSRVFADVVAPGSIVTAKLADNAVTSAKIATGAVGTTDIADSAITDSKITDLGITGGKIADNAVDAGKLSPDVRAKLDTLVEQTVYDVITPAANFTAALRLHRYSNYASISVVLTRTGSLAVANELAVATIGAGGRGTFADFQPALNLRALSDTSLSDSICYVNAATGVISVRWFATWNIGQSMTFNGNVYWD